ncbi:MAG: heparinase II/III family protein [Thermoguttaceae bacterium]|nr:heparinase II/III family protein [Thermoguttaceae bacterium]
MEKKSVLFVPVCFALLFSLLLTKHTDAEDNEKVVVHAHSSFQDIQRDEVVKALTNIHAAPRILLTDEAIESVRLKIETDPRWKGYYEAIKKDADKRMDASPVKYELTGRRLLSVSREALRRIFEWSFMYRYTGDVKYAKRVEQETVAISDFSDWHPEHFLDVAEMAVAVAIGYDSCKESFSVSNRDKVREALRVKGVVESQKVKGAWKFNTANWNQVCWCGDLYAALAIYGDETESEREITIDAICDALNGVTWSMSSYEPDGNYTEGPGYWGYGTGFNILLFGAVNSSLGTDFGRSDSNGFLKSISYYEHVFGTTGLAFNYPDSGGGKMYEASAFWYSSKLGNPNVVWNENNLINNAYLLEQGALKSKSGVRSFSSLIGHRLAVCALLWGPTFDQKYADALLDKSLVLSTPDELGYIGLGNSLCSVALFRTDWKEDAAYMGIKCGTPNSPHGHMDEGGFVYDDLGVRWFVELGPEDYHKIESRGMNLWSVAQNSDRWKLLRYNNFGHSVLVINNNLQLADQKTSFIETKIGNKGEESVAVVDLTPVYKNDVAKAVRKAILLPDGNLIIEDSFEALADKEATIERRFITTAQVEIENDEVVLTQHDPNNQNITLRKVVKTHNSAESSFQVVPCETNEDYDAKNPGVSILIETSILKTGEKSVYTTTFTTI